MNRMDYVIKRWCHTDEDRIEERGVTIVPIIEGFENFKNDIIKEAAKEWRENRYFGFADIYENGNSMFLEMRIYEDYYEEWYEFYEGDSKPAVSTDFEFPDINGWAGVSYECIKDSPIIGNYLTLLAIEHVQPKEGCEEPLYKGFAYLNEDAVLTAWRMLQHIYPEAKYKVQRCWNEEDKRVFVTMTVGEEKWTLVLDNEAEIEDWVAGRGGLEYEVDELPF